ncbi:MAG: VWA domain-containing protein [Acidobacteriota bacterium]|nr:VWA domain-containing protein [Acidobacteriota bacterium]
MRHVLIPFLLACATGLPVCADEPTFKSDVAMTRVDAQVLDQTGRAVTGLEASDFVLRLNGQVLPIRNFASENMPIDILLLLDVSGSMEPHVERIASAAQQALNVLAAKDRVAIMVFDTSTRIRLPFRSSHSEITGELDRLLRSEGFDGGTRITSAMVSAANYLAREARPDARRAIVILTDDETQDREDEARVESALARANAVLSFLQAPYEPPTARGGGGGRPRGTWGGGGGWPGGGGGWPGGGGIGFPGGGGPVVVGPGGYDPSHSAGTANIAQDSGGDTMRVEEASALEDTLARLRQRYALYFYLPEGLTGADKTTPRVDLSQEARMRFGDAEVRSRRIYISGGTNERSGPTVVTRGPGPGDTNQGQSSSQGQTASETSPAPKPRKVAVNEDSGPKVNTIDPDDGAATPPSSPAPTQNPAQTATPAPAKGGWPRATGQNSNPN